MAAYSYPILDLQDLLIFFEEHNIAITENDFIQLDPRRWHQHYGHLFELLTGRGIETATQNLCRTMQFQCEHPELFEEGFAQIAFTKCMQRIFCSCRFEDFSIDDVISPSKSRLLKMLSAFINCWNHFSLKKTFFDEVKVSLEHSRERYDALKTKQRDLQTRFNRAEESRLQRDSEKQQLQDQWDKGKQKLQELKKQQDARSKYFNEIKLSISEKEKEKESLNQRIMEMKQEIEKISLKIVHSPERFKQEQDRLKRRLSEIKDELSRKEQTLFEDRRLLDQSKGKKNSVEKLLKLSTELQERIEAESEIDKEVNKLNDRFSEIMDKGNHLYMQEEALTEKTCVRNEQRRKILAQTDVNRQETLTKQEEFKQLKEEKQKAIKQMKADSEDLENATTEMKSQCMEVHQQVAAKKERLEAESNSLMNEKLALNMKANKVFAYIKEMQKKLEKGEK